MVKEFETAAFSQKTNEVGPVIQTKFGFHIVQVSAHEPARTQSLDEVKGDIADHLKTTQERKTIDSYIAELKSKATIRYADGMAPDAGAADSGDEDSDAPDADAGDAESP
jgi:peptidyl-prolyl cis-trans isomerase C